jgi:hypothetical protein
MADNEEVLENKDIDEEETAYKGEDIRELRDWKVVVQNKINADNFDKFLSYASIDRHDGKGVLSEMLTRKSANNVWVGTEKGKRVCEVFVLRFWTCFS